MHVSSVAEVETEGFTNELAGSRGGLVPTAGGGAGHTLPSRG